MEIADLKVEKRQTDGKGAARKVRAQGMIPAVLYGGGAQALAISIDEREFANITHTEAGSHVIFRVLIPGVKKAPTAVIKEIQRNPVKNSYLHIDFQEIAMNEAINATIPLVIEGDAPGIRQGGILQHHLWEVEVQALPTEIPDHLTVDISNINIGESVHIRDLEHPEEVKILTNPDEVAVSILPPVIEKAPVEEELIEAPEEGAAPAPEAEGEEAPTK